MNTEYGMQLKLTFASPR